MTQLTEGETVLKMKELLETASIAGNVALWRWNVQTGIIDWSPIVDAMLGYEPGEFSRTLHAWEDSLHPEDKTWVMETLNALVEEGTTYDVEYRIRTKNGDYVWWHDVAKKTEEAAGRVQFVSGACVDITPRKHMEKSLKESELKYRNLFENSGIGIIVTDMTGHFLLINKIAAARMGGKPEDFLGKPWKELLPEIADNPDYLRHSRHLFETGQGLTYEATFPIKGQMTSFYITTEPIKDADGNTVALQTCCIDITDRKRAEAEIRQLNAELERRVTERTAQLEAANQELKAFSYSVAHDLRAPLRAIDGFSHILLEDFAGSLNKEGKRLLQKVRTNTRKMDQLITDLLGLSRVDQTELQLSSVNMTHLVHSVWLETVDPELREKFDFSLAPLPAGYGDHGLVRQVWVNLLSNAVKYTLPRDIRKIEVTGRTENETNIYCVRDSGVGFDPQYAQMLFGVFQRLHEAGEFEGTGIGLAIVRRIIHRHGGNVWAEGKVGGGAAFYFSLPKEKPESFPPSLKMK